MGKRYFINRPAVSEHFEWDGDIDAAAAFIKNRAISLPSVTLTVGSNGQLIVNGSVEIPLGSFIGIEDTLVVFAYSIASLHASMQETDSNGLKKFNVEDA